MSVATREDSARGGAAPLSTSVTRKRKSPTEETRAKHALAQHAYMATDPRWASHYQKIKATRFTLFEHEVRVIERLRLQRRSLLYISYEIGVCEKVLRRELKARGVDTGHFPDRPNTRRFPNQEQADELPHPVLDPA